jgi:hypothetical protein
MAPFVTIVMPSLDGRTSPITTTGTPVASMAVRTESALSGATAISNAPDAISFSGSSASALQIVSVSGNTGDLLANDPKPETGGRHQLEEPRREPAFRRIVHRVHDLADIGSRESRTHDTDAGLNQETSGPRY